MLKVYTVKKEGFKEVKKRILFRSIPLILLAIGFGMFISLFNGQNHEINTGIILSTLIIAFIAVFIGLFFSLKIQKDNYFNKSIEINDRGILIKTKDVINMEIDRKNIVEIIEKNDGSVFIKTDNKKDVLVPKYFDDLEDFKQVVSQFSEIKKENADQKTVNKQLILAVSIAVTFILMGFFYLSKNSLIIIISGILLFILLLYSFIKIITNKLIDKRIKICSAAIFFLLFSIVMKLILIISK